MRDKIRGGLLGQLLGNLNGLPHEFKYIADAGNVTEYTPALPLGAWTDDDTDFEWVYIKVMEDEDSLLLAPERISKLWRERVNKRIWCSNQYARQLMDLGIDPPLTGSPVFNPWADFNISGQFLCESFGLISPALPQRAAEIGLNSTRVAIDGEPERQTETRQGFGLHQAGPATVAARRCRIRGGLLVRRRVLQQTPSLIRLLQDHPPLLLVALLERPRYPVGGE